MHVAGPPALTRPSPRDRQKTSHPHSHPHTHLYFLFSLPPFQFFPFTIIALEAFHSFESHTVLSNSSHSLGSCLLFACTIQLSISSESPTQLLDLCPSSKSFTSKSFTSNTTIAPSINNAVIYRPLDSCLTQLTFLTPPPFVEIGRLHMASPGGAQRPRRAHFHLHHHHNVLKSSGLNIDSDLHDIPDVQNSQPSSTVPNVAGRVELVRRATSSCTDSSASGCGSPAVNTTTIAIAVGVVCVIRLCAPYEFLLTLAIVSQPLLL